jgi:dTMP kinase
VSLVRGFVAAGVPWVSAALASAPVYGYLVGERAGVALDAISFGVSALLIFSIHVRARPRATTETFRLSMLGSDIRESFQTLRSRTELRAILVSIGFAILGGGAIISVGLVYIQSLSGPIPLLSQLQHVIPSLRTFDALNAQASTTFMLAFLALGMFLGAIIVPKLAARLPLEALFVSAVALFGVSLLGFALSSVYSIASIFAVAAGFFVAQVTVAGNTFVSETVEDALRGRVFTALESVLRVSLLASMLLIAPLGDLVNKVAGQYLSATGLHLSLTGPRVTLVCAAVIVLAASVYAYAAVDWRGKRGTEAAADA